MIFRELSLKGAFCISLEKRSDFRGFFARSFCETEFAAHALNTRWAQVNVAYNIHKGTLRGLHFQRPPETEAKIVKCLRGSIYDVLVDLRASSATFGHWTSLELNSENRDMAYVPEGFAHGYQTLVDDTELMYFHSRIHAPHAEGGLHHGDSALGITWPLPPAYLSDRDRAFPLLSAIGGLPL